MSVLSALQFCVLMKILVFAYEESNDTAAWLCVLKGIRKCCLLK